MEKEILKEMEAEDNIQDLIDAEETEKISTFKTDLGDM